MNPRRREAAGISAANGIIAIAVLLVLVSCGAPRTGFVPRRSELATDEVRVALRLCYGLPMVSALVEGRGPYQFILDSGSSVVAIDQELAAELGMAQGLFRSAGAMTPVVDIHELAIGGWVGSDLQAAVFRRFRQVPLHDLRGVVGLGAFADLTVAMDQPGGTLVLSRRRLGPCDGRMVLPYDLSDGTPRIDLAIAGRTCRLALDTGSTGAMVLSRRTAAGFAWAAGPVPWGSGMNVNGTIVETECARLGSLDIGPLTAQRCLVQIGGHGSQGEFDAIGNALLRRMQVVFDTRAQRVGLVGEPTVVASQPCWTPGFSVDGGGVISRLRAASPAESVLEVGDRILAIDGIPGSAGIDEVNLREFTGPGPFSLHCEVERQGRRLAVEVALVDVLP